MSESAGPFVREVSLRYYKSIASCRVRLGRLTMLVGPNGAGKSNFLDALHFVRDSLRHTLEFALRDRGGIGSVRMKSGGHPTHFGIRLDFDLHDGRDGFYAFEIGAKREGGFSVRKEECRIHPSPMRKDGGGAHFEVRDGMLAASSHEMQAAIEPDRLFLTTISALREFRSLYDGLTSMGFYNLSPPVMRSLQDPDPGLVLEGDGRNLASVLREIARADPDGKERIDEYLRAIVPGVDSASFEPLGPKVTLLFKQSVGQKHPWSFFAENMSDGTLRVLAILVAAYQGRRNGERRVPLIGIEEPETAMHPGAAEVLAEALVAASQGVQVILTTHSPDLLDYKGFRDEQILAVTNAGGRTAIASMDQASRKAVRDGLYSIGELLRMGQIEPDEKEVERATQLDLFSDPVRK